MFNFFADLLAGYVLLGVVIAFVWLAQGLVRNKIGDPLANLDFFMLGLIMMMTTVTWGLLLLVFVADKYQRLRYGDHRSKANDEPLPGRAYRPEREKDEHEDFPGT